MARLTKLQQEVIKRARTDVDFRLRFLKAFMLEALKTDPEIINRVVDEIDKKK